jgi:MFS family permease
MTEQAPEVSEDQSSRYARRMGGRRLLVDLSPLRRHRDFRLLTAGQLGASLATQLVQIAVPYQVFETTHHSTLQVGLVSLGQLVPMLAGSMFGGVIADIYDRRRILFITRALLAVTYAGLFLDAQSHVGAVWPLYVITAVAAGIVGVSMPASTALVPNLVGVEEIPAASSISQVIQNVTTVAGPSLGGVLIAYAHSVAPVYLIAVIATAISVVTFAAMAPLARADGDRRITVAAFRDGIHYLRSDRVLAGSFLIDFQAVVFGMPVAVFPALALVYYHGGALTYGLLNSAPAAGALLGALLSGWIGTVRRQGLGLVVCVLIWGAMIALVGVIKVFWVGLVLLAIAGGADMVSVVYRVTITQTTVPDHMRGRMSAALGAFAVTGNNLGNTEAGFASAIGGPQFAVWSGGLACIVGALVFAWRVPELIAYDRIAAAQARADAAESQVAE